MRKSRTDLRTLCRIQAAGIFSRRLVRDRAHHLAADQPESVEPCMFAPNLKAGPDSVWRAWPRTKYWLDAPPLAEACSDLPLERCFAH